MTKKKIALNLSELKPIEVVSKMKMHAQKLQNNANFPNLSVTTLMAAAASLEQALLDQNVAYMTWLQQTTLTKTTLETALDELRTVAMNVEIQSLGDEQKIRSGGFDIQKDKQATPVQLSFPLNVTLKEAESSGSLALSFKPVKTGKAYIVQISYDISDPDAWVQHDVFTASRAILTPLVPGREIWVRVAAVGSGGKSDWSDVARRYVP
jgi:HPt (histidine-containing phosphotransfer) domain-containing protein